MTAPLTDRLALVVVAAATALLLGGCGSSSGPEADESSPAATSSSPTGAPTNAPDAPTSPASTAAATGVPAATGAEIALAAVRLNVPVGWDKPRVSATNGSSAANNYLMTIRTSNAIEPDIALGEFAKLWRDFAVYPIKQKIAEDVVVAGQPWFHLTGKINGTQVADDYGTISNGVQVTFGVETSQSVPAAERQAVLDSILASIVLTP